MTPEMFLALVSLLSTLALAGVTLTNGRTAASSSLAGTMEKRLAKVEADADACRQENAELQRRVAVLEDDLRDARASSSAAETRASHAEEQVRELTDENRRLRERVAHLEAEVQRLTARRT